MADNERKAQLTLTIKQAGATETAAEIKKLATTTTSVKDELGKLSRADQLNKLGTEMGTLAKKTKDVDAAVSSLTKKLVELGATQDEIKSVSGAFNAAQGEGGDGRSALTRLGSFGRSLPSTPLPGGVTSDALSNITRLAGAFTELSEKSAIATTASTLLTPALGAQTAATYAAYAPLAIFVAALGTIAVALKAIGDQAAEEAKVINSIVDAQRSIAQEIANGLTTEEAEKKLKVLNAERQAEAELLAKNQQVYRENIENQGPLTAALKLTSGEEQALSEQIEKSEGLIEGYDTSIGSLTRATENGTLAANDAAAAEEKLAEARSKEALSSADIAARELQAEQKALNATEEQNKKRLDAIVDERAVIQAQIDSLTESGVTSEEVTKRIETLTAQLGSLGKETSFITDTALAVSRQADAAKKSQKDAEDAAKKAEQAQEQYTKAVASAATAYKNSVQDIGTRLNQTLTDNTTKLNRDLTDVATKYRRDEYDLTLKANRAERDALQSQTKELLDIRRDANKEEQEALREGDFKALFLARQKQAETLTAEQETIDLSAQKRQQDIADAREDLLCNAQRQRIDRLSSYDRQNIDARTAQQRELQQAALARQRGLAVAAEANNAALKQQQSYLQQRLKLDQQYYTQSLGMVGGKTTGRTPASKGLESFIVGTVAGAIIK